MKNLFLWVYTLITCKAFWDGWVEHAESERCAEVTDGVQFCN